MAIAQDGNASFADAGTTTAAFSGLATTAGDMQIVMLVSTATGVTWTKPANFTQIDNNNGNTQTVATFVATSSLVANPSFTASSGAAGGVAIAVSGSSGVVDVHSTNYNASTTANSCAAVTPTVTNDGFFAFYGTTGNPTISSGPSGFTEDSVAGGGGGATWAFRGYYQINPALSAATPTLTYSNLDQCLAAAVVVKAATSTKNVTATDAFPGFTDGISIARLRNSPSDTFPTWTDSVAIAITNQPQAPSIPFFTWKKHF